MLFRPPGSLKASLLILHFRRGSPCRGPAPPFPHTLCLLRGRSQGRPSGERDRVPFIFQTSEEQPSQNLARLLAVVQDRADAATDREIDVTGFTKIGQGNDRMKSLCQLSIGPSDHKGFTKLPVVAVRRKYRGLIISEMAQSVCGPEDFRPWPRSAAQSPVSRVT